MSKNYDIKLIIFDFDGVLCNNKLFYCDESKKNPNLLTQIDKLIFKDDHIIIDEWMRGKYKYTDVINIIEKELHFPNEKIKTYLFESIKSFEIDKRFINLFKKLNKLKYQLILVTNNIDLFDLISTNCKLEKYFKYIIKSTDIGCLKHENNGSLYEFALSKVDENNFTDCLLIDDSEKACNTFKNKNGHVIKYINFNDMIEKIRVLLYNLSL